MARRRRMIPAFLRRDTLHITTLQPCTQAYVLALVARRMELARPSLVSCEVEVGEIGDCQFDQVHQGSCADCNDRAPTIQRESARSSIPSIRFGSQRAWRVVATFLSLCLHSKAIAWCSDMPFVSRKGCRRKRRSIWNLAAFVSAMAATFVLAITLHGLVGGTLLVSFNDDISLADGSSRLRSDSLVMTDENPNTSTSEVAAASANSRVPARAEGASVSAVSALSPASRPRDEMASIQQRVTASARYLDDQRYSAGENGIYLPRKARVGYLIMTSGVEELNKTKRLLEAIYDPSNFYLVHLDRKNSQAIRADLDSFISKWNNVRMLVPALDVSWGGYTITLTAIFGICTLVQWSDEWDFFVNLSASDFPLLPQNELMEVLGQFASVGMNFVSGAPLNERNRVEVMIDDQGLYRETQSTKAGRPLKVGKPRLPPSKSMFTVYKGEFWVILHRSFCKYVEASPDNVARSLQAYFSRFRISDESYFQTVLCHPLAPNFPVYSDNMRFVSWPVVSEGHYVLHPDPITTNNVGFAMASGALFARKFDLEVSREAYAALEGSLSEPDFDRLATAKHRFAPASLIIGRQKFCAVPKGYSIHEVLSRPPKTAMELHTERSTPVSRAIGEALPAVASTDVVISPMAGGVVETQGLSP